MGPLIIISIICLVVLGFAAKWWANREISTSGFFIVFAVCVAAMTFGLLGID